MSGHAEQVKNPGNGKGVHPAQSSRQTYRLYFHLSVLFSLLILLVGAAIAYVSYYRSAQMLERGTQTLLARISQQTVGEVGALFDPVEPLLGLLASQPVSSAPALKSRLADLGLFRTMLLRSEAVTAFFVAYDNGDIFQVQRLNNDADRKLLAAPPGADFVVQSLERDVDKAAQARFLFYDGDLNLLRSDDRPEYAKYDPRTLDWYQRAATATTVIRTTPYVFLATGKVGATLAKRGDKGHAVVGANITLQTLGNILKRQKITPHSELAVLGGGDKMLAYEDMSKVVMRFAADGTPISPALKDFGVPALAALGQKFMASPGGADQEQPLLALQVGNEGWHGTIAAMPLAGWEGVRLAMAVPDSELLAEARQISRDSVISTTIVFLLVLPIGIAMARRVSKDLGKLAEEAQAVRRFDFSKPVQVASIVKEVDDLAGTIGVMKQTIRRFLDITSAVAAEGNFDRLLLRLLDETVAAANASAGLLYLVGNASGALELARARRSEGADMRVTLPDISVDQRDHLFSGTLDPLQVLTGQLASTEATANGLQPVFTALEAQRLSYVAVPLANRKRELLGLLVLWLDFEPDPDLVRFVEALSGSAAVSLESKALIRDQKALFEAFIQLIAGAIDAKSAYTGGHCLRVPEITKMLAKAACDSTSGPFRDFRLTEEEWEAVHIAAWLHDCGKVTTPEYVVDKATKLETIYDRIHELRMRFEVLKRDAQILYWQKLAAGGSAADLRAELDQQLRQLDDDFAFVAQCNEGGESMSAQDVGRLQQIAERTWVRTLDDRIGISHEERSRKERTPAAALPVAEPLLADKPEHRFERLAQDRLPQDGQWGFHMEMPELLYNRGELYNLGIGRGTLAQEDRYKINEHIVQSIMMLSKLPFPRHLRQVPEIAGGHHEKMDGTGYPRRLKGEQMSPLARMMAIADIFEALTAVDRPYKKGKTLSEAIRIMSFMKKDQHIDPDLFELFLTSGVYRDYAEKYLRPEQIDEVVIEQYLWAKRMDNA